MERKLIWPDLENEFPDLIVSLGTTFNSAKLKTSESVSLPRRLGVISHGKSLYKIATNRIASDLDPEKAWQSYMSVLQPPPRHRVRYIRLNPNLTEDPPRLDDVECMHNIQEIVRESLKTEDKIEDVALHLVASSFYFEVSKPMEVAPDGTAQCKGLNIPQTR